jgi:probable rRNA maturation factor
MRINLYQFPKEHVALLARAARATLLYEKKAALPGEVNFILISDTAIRAMNRKYRKVHRITDVISFRFTEKPLTGDIYISVGRSRKQAKRVGHSWEKELTYLVIHGVLHLLGYTDYTPDARAAMFRQQDAIFSCLFS